MNQANFAIEMAAAMACEHQASARCQTRLATQNPNRHECVRFGSVLCVRPLRDFSTFFGYQNLRTAAKIDQVREM